MKLKFLLHKRDFTRGKEAIGNYAEVLSSTNVRHFAPNKKHGMAWIVEADIPNDSQSLQKIMDIFKEKKITPIRVFRNYFFTDKDDFIPAYVELKLLPIKKITKLWDVWKHYVNQYGFEVEMFDDKVWILINKAETDTAAFCKFCENEQQNPNVLQMQLIKIL